MSYSIKRRAGPAVSLLLAFSARSTANDKPAEDAVRAVISAQIRPGTAAT